MKAVILSRPKLELGIRVLPGSARIQVTFPRGEMAMFDPESRTWHRAGLDQPAPWTILRSLSRQRPGKLEQRLITFTAARLRPFR